jgi:MraZ protein
MQPDAATSEPVYYSARYRHGVDEKRRVQIPAKWRSAKPEVLTLIVWPKATVKEACLMVLPPGEWVALVQKLKALPSYDPKAEALRLLLGSASDRVMLDKGGRICLPEGMAKAVGIENEALLVGLVDRFQIWNPQRFAEMSPLDDQLWPEAIKQV